MTSVSISGDSNDTNLILNSPYSHITSADTVSAVTTEIDRWFGYLPSLMPKYFQHMLHVTDASRNPFLKVSTYNMNQQDLRNPYMSIVLLAWLNGEIVSSMGPTCPGISMCEMLMQGVIVPVDMDEAGNPLMGADDPANPPATGHANGIRWTKVNPDFNYFNVHLQNVLSMMEATLYWEKSVGFDQTKDFLAATMSTITGSGTNIVFAVNPQFVAGAPTVTGGSDWYQGAGPNITVAKLQSLATSMSAQNAMLPTDAEAAAMLTVFDAEVELLRQAHGLTAAHIDYSGNVVAGLEAIDVIGGVMRVLFRLHLYQATIVKKIRDEAAIPGTYPEYASPDVDLVTWAAANGHSDKINVTGGLGWAYATTFYTPDAMMLEYAKECQTFMPHIGAGLKWGSSMILNAKAELNRNFSIDYDNDVTQGANGMNVTLSVSSTPNARLQKVITYLPTVAGNF